MSLSVGDSVRLPGSADPVVIGPTIKLIGKHSADGAAFDLSVDAQVVLPGNP